MRKVGLIIVFLFFITEYNYSQRKFNFALKAGGNREKLFFSESSIISSKEKFWGIHGGVSTRFRILIMSIQPEIVYSFYQVNYKINDPVIDEKSKISFHNITIPVMFNVHFLKAFHAGLGPIYTFQIPLVESTSQHWNEFEQNYNTGSFGLQLGIGLDLGRMMIDFNYQIGLTKYKSEMNYMGSTYFLDARPSTLWISLGIWILDPRKNKEKKKN